MFLPAGLYFQQGKGERNTLVIWLFIPSPCEPHTGGKKEKRLTREVVLFHR